MSRSEKYKIHHSQNYLVNRELVRRLVIEAGYSPSETVVEIGPGKGIITRELARHAGHVLGIEYDESLSRQLAHSLPANVTVIQADAVEFPLPATPFRVFANIPFRHTAAIVGNLTTGTAPPLESRLVVQREAADRFMVNTDSTMRAQQLAPFFEIEVLHSFDRSDFAPRPNVDSVLLQIRKKNAPELQFNDQEIYGKFIDVVYSSWQPTLEKALKNALPRLAAQELSSSASVRHWMQRKPSEAPTKAWVSMFLQLLNRNDSRVWQEIQRGAARNDENRRTLQRPGRTNITRAKRTRR